MRMWRIAANPKGAIFLPSVLLFVYLYWLSCPHLFVSRSDIVPTCHCPRSWEKPGVKKHLTFPLNVLGLRLSPAGAAGRSPAACRSPGILPATLEAKAGAGRGPQEIRPGGRLSSPALEPVPQPRNELAERNEAAGRWCRLVGQALTGCVP